MGPSWTESVIMSARTMEPGSFALFGVESLQSAEPGYT